MPAPATTAELLDLISRSGLTDEARLRAYVSGLTETRTRASDPTQFAGALVRDGFLTHFQAEHLLQGKWNGFHIGADALLEFIGADTTGAFYLCYDPRIQRAVALKLLPPAAAELQNNLNRLYREARAMASCHHLNVVCVYEVGQDGNLYFLVTEYIDGANLLTIARRGPLDPIRAAHYIGQAAHGLQHIHERGLVHRNVKPAKLMVDRKGIIKLGGLGIALCKHDSGSSDETIRGTPNYIAPEQTLRSCVDHRADIYSLGCTFYHLLTGQTPFRGGSPEQKLIWHRTREPAPIRQLRPEAPEEMARVVERMMSKPPDARYQSATEVTAALAPWIGTAIAPPPAEEMPIHCPRVQEAIARSVRAQSGTS